MTIMMTIMTTTMIMMMIFVQTSQPPSVSFPTASYLAVSSWKSWKVGGKSFFKYLHTFQTRNFSDVCEWRTSTINCKQQSTTPCRKLFALNPKMQVSVGMNDERNRWVYKVLSVIWLLSLCTLLGPRLVYKTFDCDEDRVLSPGTSSGVYTK